MLLHRSQHNEYWFLPGGTTEAMEPSRECLKREMLEETGIEPSIGRLIWIVENFFELEESEWHEISFYYEVSLPEHCYLQEHDGPFYRQEGELDLTFFWQPLSELDDVTLSSHFLKEYLGSPPSAIQHLTVDQRDS